jgi:hypothetical protein
MSLNPKTAVAVRNAALSYIVTTLSTTGVCSWNDGTQPTDADTGRGAQVEGAALPLSSTAGTVSAGVLTFNAITSASSTAAMSPCSWVSFRTSGTTRLHDGSAGVGTYNLNLNSATVGSGATCSVSSASITAPA